MTSSNQEIVDNQNMPNIGHKKGFLPGLPCSSFSGPAKPELQIAVRNLTMNKTISGNKKHITNVCLLLYRHK